MGDVAKGIKSFKSNMKDENSASSEKIEEAPASTTTTTAREDETAKADFNGARKSGVRRTVIGFREYV